MSPSPRLASGRSVVLLLRVIVPQLRALPKIEGTVQTYNKSILRCSGPHCNCCFHYLVNSLEAVKGRRLKLGDTHPHTLESWHNLIELYEAWSKPQKAEHWRAKLPQIEAVE